MVLLYIDMNQPRVYMCSPSWTPLSPPSPPHPSGSSQCTSPEHPVPCIEPGLMIHFTYDNTHVSVPFSQIIPPSPVTFEWSLWAVYSEAGLAALGRSPPLRGSSPEVLGLIWQRDEWRVRAWASGTLFRRAGLTERRSQSWPGTSARALFQSHGEVDASAPDRGCGLPGPHWEQDTGSGPVTEMPSFSRIWPTWGLLGGLSASAKHPIYNIKYQSVSSVAQSCPTLCDPKNCSLSGLPVHHQLPESTQTHVHWVSDAI